ncbi:hypothetical protein F4553_002799 [Allocatelliglobosispora scoriae]|uniref:Uncharacterized protein n=1 Tax=Allocatelliglobosispora scoriae TaxID=643052 RepID=A0A841BRJ2_9ACTN|nr:hypothetical protein [Allocatelliglobosispora scoriae]MBB5869420.1 hypothetical protein [Allocatelliglobosispora scoriae]
MSFWHAIYREAAGAWRSLRYDLRRERHPAGPAGTIEEERGTTRGRVVFAGAAIMLLAGAIAGAWALVGGVRALMDPGAPPAALPAHAAPAPSRGPTGAAQPVTTTPTGTVPTLGAAPTSSPTRRGPAPSPSGKSLEPVPTPAPTCGCSHPPTPVPTPAPTSSPSPSPSPTQEPSPSPSASGEPVGVVSTSTVALD